MMYDIIKQTDITAVVVVVVVVINDGTIFIVVAVDCRRIPHYRRSAHGSYLTIRKQQLATNTPRSAIYRRDTGLFYDFYCCISFFF